MGVDLTRETKNLYIQLLWVCINSEYSQGEIGKRERLRHQFVHISSLALPEAVKTRVRTTVILSLVAWGHKKFKKLWEMEGFLFIFYMHSLLKLGVLKGVCLLLMENYK